MYKLWILLLVAGLGEAFLTDSNEARQLLDFMKEAKSALTDLQTRLEKLQKTVDENKKSNELSIQKVVEQVSKQQCACPVSSSPTKPHATVPTPPVLQTTIKTSSLRPRFDCESFQAAGYFQSGSYLIQPTVGRPPASAYCQDGWTYVLKRTTGDVNFDRKWGAYKIGFGGANGDYWLSLDMTSYLTRSRKYKMRMEVQVDRQFQMIGTYWSEFGLFRVSYEAQGYRLTIGDRTGADQLGNFLLSAGNNTQFSTRDKIHTPNSLDCSSHTDRTGGGWWYSHCYPALTGRYTTKTLSRCSQDNKVCIKYAVRGRSVYLNSAIMKMRRSD